MFRLQSTYNSGIQYQIPILMDMLQFNELMRENLTDVGLFSIFSIQDSPGSKA